MSNTPLSDFAISNNSFSVLFLDIILPSTNFKFNTQKYYKRCFSNASVNLNNKFFFYLESFLNSYYEFDYLFFICYMGVMAINMRVRSLKHLADCGIGAAPRYRLLVLIGNHFYQKSAK